MVSLHTSDMLYALAHMRHTGSRGPAVLDDFTASYGYKFADAAGYQWPEHEIGNGPNKL